MEIKLISLVDKLQKYTEMQNYMQQLMYDTIGIQEHFWSEGLTDKEIEYKHRQFLIKYNLLCGI